jgi:hypothetical protein
VLRIAANWAAQCRFGSKADIIQRPRDVRFTPESGHSTARPKSYAIILSPMAFASHAHRAYVQATRPLKPRKLRDISSLVELLFRLSRLTLLGSQIPLRLANRRGPNYSRGPPPKKDPRAGFPVLQPGLERDRDTAREYIRRSANLTRRSLRGLQQACAHERPCCRRQSSPTVRRLGLDSAPRCAVAPGFRAWSSWRP